MYQYHQYDERSGSPPAASGHIHSLPSIHTPPPAPTAPTPLPSSIPAQALYKEEPSLHSHWRQAALRSDKPHSPPKENTPTRSPPHSGVCHNPAAGHHRVSPPFPVYTPASRHDAAIH